MSIVGRLGHSPEAAQVQAIFDTASGEVRRGRDSPADRVRLAAWLEGRFTGETADFAMEGCTGWRYLAGELAAAGITPHVGEPADTAALRGRKRHAKTDKTDSRHLRVLLGGRRAAAGMPGPAVARPGMPGAAGDLSRPADRAHCLGAAHPRGAVSPGRPPARRAGPAHRRGPGHRAVSRGRRTVAGRATADHGGPGHAAGAGGPPGRAAPPADRGGPAADRGQGAARAAVRRRPGHRAGIVLLAGRGGPVLLRPQGGPVHRAGHHRLVL